MLTQKACCGDWASLDMTFWYRRRRCAVCLPWAGDRRACSATRRRQLWWILYLGVFPSAIAFTHLGLRPQPRRRRARSPQSTFLVPFITTLMAWLLLDEVPPALAFVGGALASSGC